MKYVVTNEQMKAAERRCDETALSYSRLMDNAGTACAEKIAALCKDKSARIVILCGSGNNGGDGFVIARRLAERGFEDISVVLVCGEPKTGCAKEHFDYLRSIGQIKVTDAENFDFSGADIVSDCIFGTGFHGSLPDKIARILEQANNIPLKIAVDVPSGVNSDTGEFDGRCLIPTHTFVLAAMKKGLLRPECNDILGEISLLDIGIPDDCYNSHEAVIVDEKYRFPFFPRKRSSHKGTFGQLLNIAGSRCYNGAAAMSTKAALRSGVGLCALASTKEVISMHAAGLIPATFIELPQTDDGFIGEGAADIIAKRIDTVSAICIGCGLGTGAYAEEIVKLVVKNADCPIILDADGINLLCGYIDILKERRGHTVLTPHPKEFSRISGLSVEQIQSDRITAARNFSAEYGVVLVLKGANTVIAAPDGEVFVNTAGNAGLARGGSGDVLAGIIGAFLAQGIEPKTAAISGVYCHALAADMLLAKMPMEFMLPTDVIEALAEVYRR